MTRLRSERDLEDMLFAEWRALREAGRLEHSLPRCSTRQWVRGPDDISGYMTVDYRVHRQLRIPGALGFEGAFGIADFVEQYWSVRTRNGVQDPTWLPSLNINVVELKNETLTVAHCEQVLRYAIALRQAVLMAGRSWFVGETAPANVYVRALLLGPGMTRDAEVVNGLGSMLHSPGGDGEIPLRLATFRVSATEGILIDEPTDPERFWHVGIGQPEEVKALGVDLLKEERLPQADFIWPERNDGPTYDHQTGLTTHKGRIL